VTLEDDMTPSNRCEGGIFVQTIREQATDKKFLRSIAENGYELPANTDAFAFALALLDNFLSTDEELRDELSYMILASAIIDKGHLTEQQLDDLLSTVLDNNHLFYHIGEVDTDAVFMRSFSNLIVAAILYIDAKDPTVSEQAVQQAKAALFRYAREERDWRGYIKGKGWAHAMAHLADALDICAQNSRLTTRDRRQILELLRDLAKVTTPLYHEEDMRLATAACHIIVSKEVDDAFLHTWLESCFVLRDPNVSTWRKASNMKNFLRSLYFLLLWDSMALFLLEPISLLLKRLDEPYVEVNTENA
jgi:hypothetical protein